MFVNKFYSNFEKSTQIFVSAFFLMLPFVYCFQVLAHSPAVGLLGYFPLLLLFVIFALSGGANLKEVISNASLLSLLIIAVIFHNTVSGINAILNGSIGIGGRVLVMFSLPFVVFVTGARLNTKQQFFITKIVVWTSIVVSIELLWENVHIWWLKEPSWYQIQNFNYVFAQTGRELTQLLLPGYRTTGLLEHVHVSVFYVLIGLVGGLAVYLANGARKYLFAIALCELVLVLHGVRFPVIVGALAAGVYIVLTFVFIESRLRKIRLIKALGLIGFVAFGALFMDPFGTVNRYYIPAIFDGVWNTDAPAEFTVKSVLDNGTNNILKTQLSRFGVGEYQDFMMGFFGHGVANSLIGSAQGLDDDFFVAQIFSQYGVFFGIVFYALFAVAEWRSISCLQRRMDEDSRILLILGLVVILIIGISTLHSGVIQRKVMFAILMWALSIICSNNIRMQQRF